MKIELKKSCGKAMYIQLFEAIVDEICANNLKSGDMLPSRRALAKELKIAQTTVDNAYKMLQDTGYVESIPRQGFVVSFKTNGYSQDIPWETHHPEGFVFSPNGIDFSQINRGQYAKIAKEILYNDSINLFSYVEKGGEFVLRSAISKYLYSFRDIKCSPWQIILGAGAEYLLTAISVLFDDDTKYIMENPTEQHFYKILASYHRKIVTLPLNSGAFDVDELYKSKGDILFIDSSGRFPRGCPLTEDEMQKILYWASGAPNRYIIENGWEAELNDAKKTLYSMDTNNKVIYLGSFSRTLSPALKASYVVLPDELLTLWKKKHVFYYSLLSTLEQHILAEFINKGHYVKHCKKIKKIYKERKDFLREALLKKFGDTIKIPENTGSTYLIVEPEFDVEIIKTMSRANGLKVFSINSYIQGSENNGFVDNKLILGIGELNRNQLAKSVEIMGL